MRSAEGADPALTSQTLNADGTPKRPMNAFMIFARRRRPQVSAENQAMRTGEISKLLSKEWSTMAQVNTNVISYPIPLIVEVSLPVGKAVLPRTGEITEGELQF